MTIKRRRLKDPYQPSVYGVGYLGEGEFKAFENGCDTYEYKKWFAMLRRCYDKKSLARQPTYAGCSVHKDWHNFQNFAKWLSTNKFNGLGYELDKDILISGNKVYSELTCALVPLEINTLLVCRKQKESGLPVGVDYYKPNDKYGARLKINGKYKYLGLFDCEKEAHQAYVAAKKAYIVSMAIKWRGNIGENVFNALINWHVI